MGGPSLLSETAAASVNLRARGWLGFLANAHAKNQLHDALLNLVADLAIDLLAFPDRIADLPTLHWNSSFHRQIEARHIDDEVGPAQHRFKILGKHVADINILF